MTDRCWNCGSANYIEVAAYEKCSDCGIYFNYHGSGANAEYKAACERKWVKEEEEQLRRELEEELQWEDEGW